ncbi:MAG: hypothetical protein CM1200mP16_11480 [Nitrospina sp.]|nr:MAG: hypothetical protein CM1200mP16_11480 [Nitrospina sp.]
MEHGDLIVDLGNAEGILPRREQVFRESFNPGERIRPMFWMFGEPQKKPWSFFLELILVWLKGYSKWKCQKSAKGKG